MRMLIILSALLTALLSAGELRAGDFPIADPYHATVFGVPAEQRWMPERVLPVQTRSFRVEDRETPDIFWHARDMEYSLSLRSEPAPLVFVIAGTGGRHSGGKMDFLMQLLAGAGFHVACLSSPTHLNMLVSVSEHGASGYAPWDVEDLYRVMRWIKADVESRAKVTGCMVTGYSLGGLHAAYLAKLDEERGAIGLDRALVMNPPVDLLASAMRFDSWLTPEALNGKTPQEVFAKFLDQFSDYYKNTDVLRLDGEFLYRLSDHIKLAPEELRALIAVSFRLTLGTMAFVSDVCLHAGYFVLPDYELTSSDPLMPYLVQSARISFSQYFDEFLAPYVQHAIPGATHAQIAEKCTLRPIADWLATTDKVMLIGSEDDPILGGEDLEFLRRTFGARATLFATGGHCGNLDSQAYATEILRLLGR